MGMISLAQLGAMLDPQYAAKLRLIDRQAEVGFLTASALEQSRHQNHLAEMDRELSNRLVEMQARHHLESEKALSDSIIKQMEGRSATRNEMAKMILEAAIKAKLGKIEHEQSIEKAYMSKLHEYLFELYRNNQEQAAKDYIDKLYAEAVAAGM
jgi:hypothetical protein